MADKKKREAERAKAKRVCRLNAETVRMAKELGLNPRSLMKNIPSKSQPWKAPVHIWIRDLYEERQEKTARKKMQRQAEQAARQDLSREPRPVETPPTDETGTTLSGSSTRCDLDGPSGSDPLKGRECPF